MSLCNHCGRFTDNTKLGEDCKFCKEVYAQGVADGKRLGETERIQLLAKVEELETELADYKYPRQDGW